MIRYILITIGLIAFNSMALAHVTTMSNKELDDVVLPTQQPEQLQPTLPEYDSNGQIGTVAAENGTIPISSVQSIRVDTSATNPVMPTLPPAIVSQLNQIFNLAGQR